MVHQLFDNETALGQIVTKHRENTILTLFRGMNVMVTYNQDKTIGVVNGALGKVLAMRRSQNTVRLQNGNETAKYWQTWTKDDVRVAGLSHRCIRSDNC